MSGNEFKTQSKDLQINKLEIFRLQLERTAFVQAFAQDDMFY